MRLDKFYKINIIAILFIFIMIIWNVKSYAAAGSFQVTPLSITIDEGKTATIKITATNCGGQFTFKSSDSSIVEVSTSQQWIESGSETITITAKKAGSAKITITANNVADTSENDVTGDKEVNIKVNSTSTSGNSGTSGGNMGGQTTTQKKGTVSSCYINGILVKKDLTVTNKDSVSVKVNTSTKEGLTIYNSLNKKTYKLASGETANVQIAEGTNTLTIKLDSGATATRKVYSQKEEETPGNFIEEQPKEDVKVLLKSLSIKSVKLEGEDQIDFKLTPEFSSEVYEYSIIIPAEHNDIAKLDIEALGSQEDFTVEITGNENLKDGENIVTILVKSKDGAKSATYKIIVNKEPKAVETVAEPVEDVPQTTIEEDNNSRTIIKIAIVVFTSIVAILGIIFAIVEYMYGKKHNKENEFGSIPYASIGFEKEETDKEDVLGDLKNDDKEDDELEEKKTSKRERAKREEDDDVAEKNEKLQEEEKTKRRGKHF